MKESMADRIQLLRKQAGLTQIELAGKIGVSKSQFIRYDSKDVQPPANIINKLADVLGTSVDFLISGDKTEKAKASLKNSELIQRFKEVDEAAKRSGMLYSLFGTCKLHGIEPYGWLKNTLRKIPSHPI